jgi:transcriptional regulator with XRE-family HTH domain|nr:MAG TPA: structural protein [Caudoviricetes sp.]
MESLVAQRIKSVLESKQISIAAFSKMIGMQQVTCNRQLRGDQAVSLGLIEGFLKEFDEISAEWLFRGKENRVVEERSVLAAEPEPEYGEDKNDLLNDSVWKAKYEELEKRYDQLLSILGGSMRKADVG